jgi:hypothetical protein
VRVSGCVLGEDRCVLWAKDAADKLMCKVASKLRNKEGECKRQEDDSKVVCVCNCFRRVIAEVSFAYCKKWIATA